MLRIDPRDAVPIWKQIEEGVRHLVAAGALEPEGAMRYATLGATLGATLEEVIEILRQTWSALEEEKS